MFYLLGNNRSSSNNTINIWHSDCFSVVEFQLPCPIRDILIEIRPLDEIYEVVEFSFFYSYAMLNAFVDWFTRTYIICIGL